MSEFGPHPTFRIERLVAIVPRLPRGGKRVQLGGEYGAIVKTTLPGLYRFLFLVTSQEAADYLAATFSESQQLEEDE